ncbi:MAG: hypothetical protein GY856_16545 [bacterium]|nr:hypothetical protein [bacterium]
MRSLLATLLLLAGGSLCLAVEPPGAKYICWPLPEALDDLRDRGLNIIYSSDLVRPEMQITSIPAADSLPRILDELLLPHGLRARHGTNDVLLVVRAAGSGGGGKRARLPAPESDPDAPATLPEWISSDLIALPFPLPDDQPTIVADRVPSNGRHLVIRLMTDHFADWDEAAFDLKELIVDVKSRAKKVLVALEGPPAAVEELVSRGLAPYVDAYTYRDQRFVPRSDPTARLWWRTRAVGPAVLTRLVEAVARGDELVVVEGLPIDPTHEAFLRRIQATLSGNLDVQPRVQGIAAERVRFFLNPETGDYYLAVYATPDEYQSFTFFLHQELEARSLFPVDAPFVFFSYPTESGVILDGPYPYYLFELRKKTHTEVSDALEVDSTRIIDPYEEVVKNQVFQEQQKKKFRSLDVMEYATVTEQDADSDQYFWIHRNIHRKGRLSEYHHLEVHRNGVKIPEDRMLKGRLFRTEALLQLRPLEIELDETYRYEYLGEEIVDSHPTWKIRFEPLREGSVADGTFVSGIVWLDQKNNSHRKMRTYQVGLDNSLISQERTTFFEWIPSNGECFWDWRRQDSVVTQSYLGEQYSSLEEFRRADFKYNRPDIEEVVREAYASDIMIHVETPPAGHRWLVKVDGKRKLGDYAYARQQQAPEAAEQPPVVAATQPQVPLDPVLAATSESEYGDRVLADIHAFSKRTRFSLGGYGWDGGGMDLYPGFVYTDSDFFKKGYQVYAGFFLEEAILSVGRPNLFGKGWYFTGRITWPYAWRNNHYGVGTPDGEYKDLRVKTREESLSLSLGIPVTRRFTINTAYLLRNLSFATDDRTDPDFTPPNDTMEHAIDLNAEYRWKRFSSGVGFEAGRRADWQDWGLDQSESLQDSYYLFRLSGGYYQRIKAHQSLGVTVRWWQSIGTDRFSRRREGRSRDRLAGFGAGLGFDKALNMSIGYHFNLFRHVPIRVRLDGGRQWLEPTLYDGPRDFVGITGRFLIHGPWKIDIWPSVSYGLYSNVLGEEGHTTLGIRLGRAQ